MFEKKISSTKNTPEISLNPDGIIKITGRSMCGNVTEFNGQIEEWIDEYVANPADSTTVDIYLEYCNTTSFKSYFNLLAKIGSLKSKNKKYTINWFYEEGDEDILEKGECISSALDLPFNFIMIGDPTMLMSDSLNWKTKVI